MESDLWAELLGKIEQLSPGASVLIGTDLFMHPPSAIFETFLAQDKTEDISQTERSHIVDVIAKASLNPISIEWDIVEYIESKGDSRSRFPQPSLGHISVPATIVDIKGRIIVWYLPGILTSSRQRDVLTATTPIAKEIAKNVKDAKPIDPKPGRKRKPKSNCKLNWRVDRKYFALPHKSRKFPGGVETYSAGWFAQGHGLDRFTIKPSRSLRNKQARRWLDASANLQVVSNNILSLIHPSLYENAMDALNHLRHDRLTGWAAKKWHSAFTGIAVIANRCTIPHLDRLGSEAWYDILFASGNYDRARLIMSEIGLSLEYSSGIAVALCGNALFHEVKEWGDGDRICYAMFMRREVLKRFGCHFVGWSMRDTYLSDME